MTKLVYSHSLFSAIPNSCVCTCRSTTVCCAWTPPTCPNTSARSFAFCRTASIFGRDWESSSFDRDISTAESSLCTGPLLCRPLLSLRHSPLPSISRDISKVGGFIFMLHAIMNISIKNWSGLQQNKRKMVFSTSKFECNCLMLTIQLPYIIWRSWMTSVCCFRTRKCWRSFIRSTISLRSMQSKYRPLFPTSSPASSSILPPAWLFWRYFFSFSEFIENLVLVLATKLL